MYLMRESIYNEYIYMFFLNKYLCFVKILNYFVIGLIFVFMRFIYVVKFNVIFIGLIEFTVDIIYC